MNPKPISNLKSIIICTLSIFLILFLSSSYSLANNLRNIREAELSTTTIWDNPIDFEGDLIAELWREMFGQENWENPQGRAKEIIDVLREGEINVGLGNQFELDKFVDRGTKQFQPAEILPHKRKDLIFFLSNARLGTENIARHAYDKGLFLCQHGKDAIGKRFIEYALIDCGPGFFLRHGQSVVPISKAVDRNETFGHNGSGGFGLTEQIVTSDNVSITTFHMQGEQTHGRRWRRKLQRDDTEDQPYEGEPIVPHGTRMVFRKYIDSIESSPAGNLPIITRRAISETCP